MSWNQLTKPKTILVKKITALLLFPAILFLFNGCTRSESCTPVDPSAEATMILAFATANAIDVVSHPSGVYYEIIDAGAGAAPDNDAKISVTYKTWYLDGSASGSQVDEATATTPLELSQFIEGWQVVLPLLQEGGRIKMIVPSALAFGCQPHNGLPGNAVLYFDITLISVQ